MSGTLHERYKAFQLARGTPSKGTANQTWTLVMWDENVRVAMCRNMRESRCFSSCSYFSSSESDIQSTGESIMRLRPVLSCRVVGVPPCLGDRASCRGLRGGVTAVRFERVSRESRLMRRPAGVRGEKREQRQAKVAVTVRLCSPIGVSPPL